VSSEAPASKGLQILHDWVSGKHHYVCDVCFEFQKYSFVISSTNARGM
jgi:hypothetical protein